MRASYEPFFRASVGYDSLLRMLEASGKADPAVQGPPYDIVKSSEDEYRVTIAVPGYGGEDVEVTQHDTLLMVTGKPREGAERDYLHRGIPSDGFESRFQIAHHVQVVGATLNDGLLTIDLKREMPEAMKPRNIPIAASGGPAGRLADSPSRAKAAR